MPNLICNKCGKPYQGTQQSSWQQSSWPDNEHMCRGCLDKTMEPWGTPQGILDRLQSIESDVAELFKKLSPLNWK